MTPETRLKNKIKAYLDSRPDDLWYSPIVASGFSRRGLPDYIGCYRPFGIGCNEGRFFSIEAKSEDGKESPLQAYTAKRIRKVKGAHVVARSVSDVKRMLDSLDKIG